MAVNAMELLILLCCSSLHVMRRLFFRRMELQLVTQKKCRLENSVFSIASQKGSAFLPLTE